MIKKIREITLIKRIILFAVILIIWFFIIQMFLGNYEHRFQNDSNRIWIISILSIIGVYVLLFSKSRDNLKESLDWDGHLNKVYDSVSKDELSYPIIMFCHVLWDFQVYNNPTDIIGDSISGHWGLNAHLSKDIDELEIVVDSSGKTYKLSHNHYSKNTQTGFSYPSIFRGTQSLEDLKKRILKGCNDYILRFQDREEFIDGKMRLIKQISSIPDLIRFVEKELNL